MEHVEAEGMSRLPDRLEFDWDIDTGKVPGPSAEAVLAHARDARALGCLSSPSGAYTEADPLTTRVGMAMLLLWMGYRLPAEFADDVLAVVDEDEPGAVPVAY